jgi:hypothetical protein
MHTKAAIVDLSLWIYGLLFPLEHVSVKVLDYLYIGLAIAAFLDTCICGNQKRSGCIGGLVMPHGFSSHHHSW